jgi:hypothetical protein
MPSASSESVSAASSTRKWSTSGVALQAADRSAGGSPGGSCRTGSQQLWGAAAVMGHPAAQNDIGGLIRGGGGRAVSVERWDEHVRLKTHACSSVHATWGGRATSCTRRGGRATYPPRFEHPAWRLHGSCIGPAPETAGTQWWPPDAGPVAPAVDGLSSSRTRAFHFPGCCACTCDTSFSMSIIAVGLGLKRHQDGGGVVQCGRKGRYRARWSRGDARMKHSMASEGRFASFCAALRSKACTACG